MWNYWEKNIAFFSVSLHFVKSFLGWQLNTVCDCYDDDGDNFNKHELRNLINVGENIL